MTKLTFTTSDVAIVLQQPQAKVQDFIRQGEIRARNCLSGAYTILRQDLLTFMDKHNYCTTMLDKNKTILILNDNTDIQLEIEQVLESLPHNCEIITISSAYEAVTTLLQEKTDLLILNNDCASFDTMGIYKELAKTSSPPILVTLFHHDHGSLTPVSRKHPASLSSDGREKLATELQHFIDK